MEDLNRSWAANLIEDVTLRLCKESSGTMNHPPAGLLELSFDGSFFKHIHLEGIGGVFLDSSGVV